MRRRFSAFGAFVVVALLAAACGGGNGETTGGATGGTGGGASGSVSMMAVWTGAEQAAVQAVLDGFKEQNPDVNVTYTAAGDQLPTQLSTAVQGGNPPDLAALPQPGLMTDFVKKNALQPLDFASSDISDNFGQSVVDLGTVDGKLYGFLFKAANKSLVWYNAKAYSDAGVEPADDWINRAALAGALDRATAGDKQQRVFLRADKTVPYGELMSLMNELRGAGYLHVALVGLEADKM